MKENKYTIKDIAKLANVSRGTVDRVLHNRGKVSHKTREKIEKVLSEIHYQPNQIARSLKHNKHYQLIVLISQTDDPYWEMVQNGILQAYAEFHSFGISVRIQCFSPNRKDHFLECFQNILAENPDGIAISPLIHEKSIAIFEEGASRDIPIIVFNSPVQTFVSGFIGQDLYQSGRLGGELLAKMNRKGGKMAMIHVDEVFENSRFMQEKELGFNAYFSDKPQFQILSFQLDQGDPSDQEMELEVFFAKNQDLAGVCVTTSKTYRVANVIKRLGMKTRLIGYDLISENVTHLLSGTIDYLIHQNPFLQGYLSVATLAEYLLFQKEIPATNYLPIGIVGQENVNMYLMQMETTPNNSVFSAS